MDAKIGSNPSRFIDLRLKPLDGAAERVLAHIASDDPSGFVRPKTFSADGRFLIYSDPRNALRVMNVETAESWLLFNEKQGDVSFEWADADWSPNKSFIVLTGSTTRTTWRAFDGLTYDAVTKILKNNSK